jgi:hypothetical protein
LNYRPHAYRRRRPAPTTVTRSESTSLPPAGASPRRGPLECCSCRRGMLARAYLPPVSRRGVCQRQMAISPPELRSYTLWLQCRTCLNFCGHNRANTAGKWAPMLGKWPVPGNLTGSAAPAVSTLDQESPHRPPYTPQLSRRLHHPQHRGLIGLLVARKKSVGISPAARRLYINQREILALGSPLPGRERRIGVSPPLTASAGCFG